MAARGYLFEGSLYMEPIVGGVVGAMVGPLEGTRFQIQPNVEQKDMISRGRGSYGQILESVSIQQPATFAITLAEGSPEVLALGLMGSISALSQTAGNLTAVDVVTVADKWVALTKANLTGTATVTNSGATTTYVEGTDYLINRQLGRFKALSTGTIASGATVKLTSAYGAISGSRISGATTPDMRARFTLDGRNLADQSNAIVTVYEAVLAPDQAQDLLSGEFMLTSLSGRMKTPAGFTAPFIVDLRTTG